MEEEDGDAVRHLNVDEDDGRVDLDDSDSLPET